MQEQSAEVENAVLNGRIGNAGEQSMENEENKTDYGRPYVVMSRPLYAASVVSSFFPHLFSTVTDWMSTILPYMMCLP